MWNALQDEITIAQLAARRLYDHRRCRDQLLGPYATLVGEPVWDMLLTLFTANSGPPAAGAAPQEPLAPEIAARATAVLDRLGLAERSGRGDGMRRVQLSSTGLVLMTHVVMGSTLPSPSDL